jgi:pilus assembly protein CpaD
MTTRGVHQTDGTIPAVQTRTIVRTRSILAVIGLAGAVAGCSTLPPPQQPLRPERTSEMPNAIEVSLTHRTLAVHFDPGDTAPRPKDVAALNVLLATGDVSPGDMVKIERAMGALADVRARGLASALARQGLRPTLAAPGGAPDGELHLVVEHATTSVPDCPNWTEAPGNPLDNRLHSDFGCATALDLAAMVADPRDLVEGRPLAPVVGDAAIFPINRYRTGVADTGPQPWLGASTTMAIAPPPGGGQPGAERPLPGATGDPGAAGKAVAAADTGAPAPASVGPQP